MGVTGLTDYIKDKIPQAIQTTTLETFRGQRIAFDVSIWAYRFSQSAHRGALTGTKLNPNIASTGSSLDPAFDEAKRLRIWLERFFMMMKECATAGVTPILVFDGPSPPEKTRTKQIRAQTRKPAQDDLKALQEQWDKTAALDRTTEQLAELRAAMLKAVELPPGGFDKLRQTFEKLGIPCLKSTCEADCLCAALAIEGIVAAVASTDSDLLLHGVDTMITTWGPGYAEFTVSGQTEPELRIQIETIHRPIVMAALGLTQRQLVDLGLICGTDYNCGLRGIGVAKGLDRIRKGQELPEQVNDIDLTRLYELFQYIPHDKLIDRADQGGIVPYHWDAERFRANFDLLDQIIFQPDKLSWMIEEVAKLTVPTVVYSKPLAGPPKITILQSDDQA